MPVAFDTLAYARRLREIGFDEGQAEGMTQALATAMTDTLATKDDLNGLRIELREVEGRLQTQIDEVKADVKNVRLDVKADMVALESRLTLRLGGLMMAGIGVVSALVKLL